MAIASRRPRTLAPVRASVGIEMTYRKKLDKLIDEMHRSIVYWISAAYRKNEPVLAMAADELPARALAATVRRLQRYWTKKFNDMAQELATYFGQAVAKRSDAALQSILRRGGMSVRFQMTRGQRDVLQATVQENVSLIKSIPQQHLQRVEGLVMRSVQTGRDLATLTDELQHQFGVTRRRAELIARDQNNKATGALQRVRHTELGITEAIWVHSGGGRHPRPSHVKAGRDKVKYNVATGWFDPAEKRYVLPGELINCRCVARPVILGFE